MDYYHYSFTNRNSKAPTIGVRFRQFDQSFNKKPEDDGQENGSPEIKEEDSSQDESSAPAKKKRKTDKPSSEIVDEGNKENRAPARSETTTAHSEESDSGTEEKTASSSTGTEQGTVGKQQANDEKSGGRTVRFKDRAAGTKGGSLSPDRSEPAESSNGSPSADEPDKE